MYDPDFDDGSAFGEGHIYDKHASEFIRNAVKRLLNFGELRLLELSNITTMFELFISKSDFSSGERSVIFKECSFVEYDKKLMTASFCVIVPDPENFSRLAIGVVTEYKDVKPSEVETRSVRVSIRITVV